MSGAEQQCVRLRSLVQDCLAKHMYDSAAFFADKLVTLSQRAPADIYLLAQVRRDRRAAADYTVPASSALGNVTIPRCIISPRLQKGGSGPPQGFN